MKRRIIAALTALVMVVTMIPASAFAATAPNTAEYVDGLIRNVITISGNSGTFSSKDATQVKSAFEAYSKLPSDELKKLEDAAVYKNSYAYLEAAMLALKDFDNKVADFNAKTAEFKTGEMTAADMVKTSTVAGNLGKAYNAVKDNTYGYFDLADQTRINVTMNNSVADKDLNAVGVDLVKLTQACEDTSSPLAKYFTSINNITDAYTTADNLAAIDAKTYNVADGTALGKVIGQLNAAKKVETPEMAAYAYLAANYDNYMKFVEKVTVWDNLYKDITTEEASKFVASGSTITSVLGIAKKAETWTEFEKNMTEADNVVTENGRTLKPVDFAKDEYKAFIEGYDLAKANVAIYKDKDAIIADIETLPSKEEVAKMSYEEALKLYERVNKIVEKTTTYKGDVVAENSTTIVTALKDATTAKKLSDTVTNVENRLKEFGGTSAADFAAKIADAVAKLPATTAEVTRADIANVDTAIELIQSYRTISSDAAVKVVYKLSQEKDGVFSLANNANRVLAKDAIKGSKLETELNKVAPNAWLKLVAATEKIYADAKADQTKADAVARIITGTKNPDPATDFVGELASFKNSNGYADGIYNKAQAEKAKAVIAHFNEEYAKLTGYAKSDFDAAVKSEAAYKNIYKEIEAAEKEIYKYTFTDEDIAAALNIKPVVEKVAKTDEGLLYAGSSYLPTIKAEIAQVEEVFKTSSVKNYFINNYNDLYKEYVAKKEKVDSFVADSAAVAALIKAIDAITVIDEKDAVTITTVDSVIASYESALKAYDALTAAEKAKVTNYNKLAKVKAGIKIGLDKIFIAEVAKIGNYTAGLTDIQIEQINMISAMVKSYDTEREYFDIDNLTATLDGADKAKDTYKDAVKKLEDTILDKAQLEYLAIKPLVMKAITVTTVDKTNALDIIKAVDAVNGMSDGAKKYFEEKDTALHASYIAKVAFRYNDAKALVLDYATVEVKDIEFDGTPATPEVVVKDFYGGVIAADQYVVSYSNNEKPGTAKVIVTATADGKYVGTVTKEFKVIGKDLAKVGSVKFDTDYGIVRVYFDRTADIEGIDVRYQVQYKKTTSDTWTTKYPTKGLDYLTLKNLTKNGKYDVRVRAYTDDYGTERVYGEYSDVQTVYANRNGSKSGIMYKAVIKNLTTKNGSVTMTVNPVKYQTVPQGVTWKYSYKKYGSQYTTWSTAKTTKNTSYTFKNLKKGTRYVFRAQYTYTSAVDGKTAVNSNYSVYKNIVVK